MKKHKTILTVMVCIIALLLLAPSSLYSQSSSIPKFSSDKEKQDWINKNPELYKSSGGQVQGGFQSDGAIRVPEEPKPVSIEPEFNPINEPEHNPIKEIVIMENDETFPTYVLTGNDENDKAVYESKKLIWIAENQEKYNNMNKNNNVEPK